MLDLKNYIISNNLGKIEENKSFKELTTLRMGGKIRLVYYPNSIDNFITFYNYLIKSKVEMFIIGSGSNIFASDKEFNGVVVSFKNLDIKYFQILNKVTAYPGCSVVLLALDMARNGYSGGEFLSGIPVTIGGAIYMNCGANGGEIKDLVEKVTVIDDFLIKDYENKDLEFSYRKSRFQVKPMIILEAKLKFYKELTKGAALEKIKVLKETRLLSQPLDKFSAGCCFQNPKSIPAWKLIDKIGLRGYFINDAKVSEKHANFLINEKNASSTDMLTLISIIKSKVKAEFNIDLVSEWILVNFD